MKDNDPDKVTDTKTMYDVSLKEVFWRNIIAGAGRAIGGLIFQILFLVVIANLFMQFVWPILGPVVETLQSTTNTLQQLELKKNDSSLFQWGENK